MSQCTWQDPAKPPCSNRGLHPQTAQDGEVWAVLCDEHHEMLDSVIGKDVKKMLSYWVRAQGGAKTASNRMLR